MPTLMVSISGIRGLIGDGLEPEVIVKYTSAYAEFIGSGTVVVGRDSRISGEMVRSIVCGTLTAKGINVIDIAVCPTPTVQYTVKTLNAQGGIAISASHNPNEWNALKLLNSTGQFMTPDENVKLQEIISNFHPVYKTWDKLGTYSLYKEGLERHKKDVLALPILNLEAIRKRNFKVLLDCVNGAGYTVIPQLLRDLGCTVIERNCESTGIFPRLPEPLPENLVDTMKAVKENNVDLGVVVDPDVDRLVLITEKGEPFIEENTIAHITRLVLSKTPGSAVVNLSTTRAVDDIAASLGSKVHRSAVGEANVVKKMQETGAVIGGEGSGGVIYPALHYGRDALVGVALTLQHLLEFGGTLSELKASLPQYYIAKKKIETGSKDPGKLLAILEKRYASEKINTEDGLRIDFTDHWVHFRKSNTEPIIRVITEAGTQQKAEEYIDKYFTELNSL
ncbi:MAG: phosphoglucosamine mutase [Ignavibacteriales bacterium]|nr:Phosphomannomutase/phosphoglucomutase [Ignavibacteriaceae bacterium]QOJ29129.1 MAG: phosphoglucosamine mutase [Ignavibacteriales bacterium]